MQPGGEAGRPPASGAAESLDIFGPGVVVADPYGSVYVAVRDGIYKVDTGGARARIAGLARRSRYSGDGGPAIHSGMNPRGMAVDRAGNLYFADAVNNRVRKLERASGVISTIAGNGVSGFSGDGGPAVAASLDGPTGVALDPFGDLYISDGATGGRNRIRKVDAATGMITTIAWKRLSGMILRRWRARNRGSIPLARRIGDRRVR